MFIAALFTIAKLWKQPRCPTTRRKHRGLLQDTGTDKNSFHRTPTAHKIREFEKCDCIKLKHFCRAEKQSTE
jgi:hypothetical protein